MKYAIINLLFFVINRLLHASYRYKLCHPDLLKKGRDMSPKGSVAFATWHTNSLAGTLAHTYQDMSPLCSRSPDGQMVAFVCKHMGLKPVCGSSSTGGKAAREELLENISNGSSIAITVDGPKGPRFKAKPGIIDIARKSRVAVMPTISLGRRSWTIGSWDKLRIPKPFTRVVLCYNEPFLIPENAEGDEFEKFRQKLDDSLMELEEIARRELQNC